MLAAYVGLASVYFPWRLTVFNANAPVFSTLFYSAELITFVWGLIYVLSVLRFPLRSPPPAPPGLAVDVYIPTYNEPVEIVRRTVVAALRISYPHETWLLDDGNRPEMRAMAEELGCRYIARTDNLNAKAGNLNNALKQTKGAFIASFDADFIAAPNFLDRTLGYFNDEKVALVQTPQEYYNFDSFQHIGRNRGKDSWSEHALFFRVIQRGRDFFHGAMFCGCSAVLRRAALDDIGGIATGTVTEDMHTSFLLHDAGWTSVYHPETLSAGLSPYDALSFRKQRLRWAQGAMQLVRKGLFNRTGKITPGQRFGYILHVLTHMEAVHHTVLYLVPFMALLFGMSPFNVDFGTWGMFSIPYIVVSILTFEEFSRGYGRLILNETFNLARFPSAVRALPALFGRRHIPFWVTPKVKSQGSFFALPWFILSLILLSLAKISWDAWNHALPYTGWPLFMMVFWAVISCIIAVRVILLTQRCGKNRRNFSRFPVALPARLREKSGERKSFDATVSELSDQGMTLRAAAGGDALPPGTYAGETTLLGKDIAFDIDLRATGQDGAMGGRLSWPSAAARDNYEYLILIDRIRWLKSFDDSDGKSILDPLLQKKRRRATGNCHPFAVLCVCAAIFGYCSTVLGAI